MRTFSPQIRLVSDFICHAAGLIDDGAGYGGATILRPRALRNVCVFGVLHLIWNHLSASVDSEAWFEHRAQRYQSFYRRALRNAVVEVDTNGDGRPDVCRPLGILQLLRV